MRIDLRFTEIGYELMVLKQYVDLVDAHMPAVLEAERARIWADLNTDDEGDRSTGWHLEDLLDQGVTTRFLTAAAVIGGWATYESAVDKLGAYVRHRKEISLRLSQLKGDFLTRARTYFDDVLKVDLHPLDADWDHLEHLQALRNLLAHGNGVVSEIRPDVLKKHEKWLRSTPGLAVVNNEYVVVSMSFAKSSVGFVDGLVAELTDRVRKHF